MVITASPPFVTKARQGTSSPTLNLHPIGWARGDQLVVNRQAKHRLKLVVSTSRLPLTEDSPPNVRVRARLTGD